MLREHAPLIGVSVVVAILFYLVFRDLRSLRSELDARDTSASLVVGAGDPGDEPATAAPLLQASTSQPGPVKGAPPEPTDAPRATGKRA